MQIQYSDRLHYESCQTLELLGLTFQTRLEEDVSDHIVTSTIDIKDY